MLLKKGWNSGPENTLAARTALGMKGFPSSIAPLSNSNSFPHSFLTQLRRTCEADLRANSALEIQEAPAWPSLLERKVQVKRDATPGGGERGCDGTSRHAGPTQVCWHPQTSFLKGPDKSVPITVIKLNYPTIAHTEWGPWLPGRGPGTWGVEGDCWEQRSHKVEMCFLVSDSQSGVPGTFSEDSWSQNYFHSTTMSLALLTLPVSQVCNVSFLEDTWRDDIIILMTTGMCACVVLCFKYFSVVILTRWILTDTTPINKILGSPPQFLRVLRGHRPTLHFQFSLNHIVGAFEQGVEKAALLLLFSLGWYPFHLILTPKMARKNLILPHKHLVTWTPQGKRWVSHFWSQVGQSWHGNHTPSAPAPSNRSEYLSGVRYHTTCSIVSKADVTPAFSKLSF